MWVSEPLMNTTHDIHTEIDTTALFHNMEVPHGCYCRNINKSYAFSLSPVLLCPLTSSSWQLYTSTIVWMFLKNQPEISTFREKRPKEMSHKPNQQAQLQIFNPLNPELNPICYLLALLGAHHFLHVSRIRVKLLTFRRLMSYIYGARILDVSRSHTTTQHSR